MASPTPRLIDGSRNSTGSKLAVDVGDMHQRDVAERLEAQQVGLGQALLREGARPAGGQKRRGRGGQLDKVAP